MREDPEGLAEFEARYGQACSQFILEDMCDVGRDDVRQWRNIPGKHGGRFQVTSRETLDREGGNHRYCGEIKIGPRWWEFQVESGNWNGTVIEVWERMHLYKPPPNNTLWIFMPIGTIVTRLWIDKKDGWLRDAWKNFLIMGKESAIWQTPIV
jgi:hypothetical protein